VYIELFKESGYTPTCIELYCGNCIKWYTFGWVRFDAYKKGLIERHEIIKYPLTFSNNIKAQLS